MAWDSLALALLFGAATSMQCGLFSSPGSTSPASGVSGNSGERYTARSAYEEAHHQFYQLENRKEAYRLARLSYELEPSEQALMLLGGSACLLGDTDGFRFFTQHATPQQREGMRRRCNGTPTARAGRERVPSHAALAACDKMAA